MRQTVTLSKKDIRRIVGIKDRLVAMVVELENGNAPPVRRRRRKKLALPEPAPVAKLRKRAAPALTPPA
jgi:hypothetical protein